MSKTSGANAVTTLDDAPATTTTASPAAGTPVDLEAAVLVRHNDDLSGERRLLTIHAESGEGGNHAVFIGLNGVGYQVPRARSFNVPAELVENLNNAQQVIYERNDAGQVVPRTSPRFAYTVLPAPAVGKAAAPTAK